MAFAVSSPAKWVPPGGGQFWTLGPTADPGQILAKQLGLQSHGSAAHEGQTRCTVRWTASTWEITPQQPRTPKPMIKTHTLVTLVTLDQAVGEVFRVNTRQKSPATYYPYLQSEQATTLGLCKGNWFKL